MRESKRKWKKGDSSKICAFVPNGTKLISGQALLGMEFLQLHRNIPPVGPQTIFEISGFPIANSTLMAFLLLAIVAIFVWMISRRITNGTPRGMQNTAEALYEGIKTLISQIMGEGKYSNALFDLIAALFIYIGLANSIDLIPGVGSFEIKGVPIFRSPTTDFNTTLGLALAIVVLAQIASLRRFGVFKHVGKYFQVREVIRGFRRGIGEGGIAVVGFFVGFLDIIGEFAKVVSLSLRLFGNMYAGAVLATIALGAFALFLPSLWIGLSLFFAVVQAIVFGSLAAAYYSIAVEDGGEER